MGPENNETCEVTPKQSEAIRLTSEMFDMYDHFDALMYANNLDKPYEPVTLNDGEYTLETGSYSGKSYFRFDKGTQTLGFMKEGNNFNLYFGADNSNEQSKDGFTFDAEKCESSGDIDLYISKIEKFIDLLKKEMDTQSIIDS